MTETPTTALRGAELIDRLEAQEAELVWDRFDLTDAWKLGCAITSTAQESGHPVGIDIRRSGMVLFRAMLPGATPDQDSWIARKSAVVLRMEASSALVDARLAQAGIDPTPSGWLGPEYAVTGGSFPIRVRGGGVVAAATVSGLTSLEDHELIVAGIRSRLADSGTR
ncbi:MAG: heme-binding protein [Microbacteriaceae bacterium]|nr:heme-binding protein [Microbacteriaceae bacterium]